MKHKYDRHLEGIGNESRSVMHLPVMSFKRYVIGWNVRSTLVSSRGTIILASIDHNELLYMYMKFAGTRNFDFGFRDPRRSQRSGSIDRSSERTNDSTRRAGLPMPSKFVEH